MKHRSINERLARTSNPNVKREIINDWIDGWEDDHRATLYELGNAIRDGDDRGIAGGIASLREIANKRFNGLRNMLNKLIEEGKNE